MKKMISILLVILLTLSSLTSALAEAVNTELPEAASASDTLIVYFTRVGVTAFEPAVDVVSSASLNLDANGELTGNCAIAASYIHDAIGGDLFQIATAQRYPSAYRATTDVAAIEQDANARPVLTSIVENMAQYSTVFLVYPNWWGALPMAMNTFLESYDFSGKTIIPLCTHEGSGLGRTPQEITALCPNAVILDGLAIRGGSVAGAQNSVKGWLQQLGLLQ